MTLFPANSTRKVSGKNTKEAWVGQYDVPAGLPWALRYVQGVRECDTSNLEPVKCSSGFEEVGGKCKEQSCGQISSVNQNTGAGSSNSRLRIEVRNAKQPPKIVLYPVNSSKDVPVTRSASDAIWVAERTIPTGDWEFRYMGCTVQENLLSTVSCSSGFEEKHGECAPVVSTCGATEDWLEQGPGVGSPNSNLTLRVTGTRTKPKIALYPVKGTKQVPVKQGKTKEWTASLSVPVGT